MNNDFDKSFKQFIRTSNATTKALVLLIKDLAPILGYDKAQKLIDIISEAQEGGVE